MNFTPKTLLFIFGTLFLRSLQSSEDLLLQDFENNTYAPWIAEGSAFGSAPVAVPKTAKNTDAIGFSGNQYASSVSAKEGEVGKLKSPEFKIERRYIRFQIAGNPDKNFINLICEGQKVRSTSPFKSSVYLKSLVRWEEWDVADLAGKEVRIEMVDEDPRGAIMGDHFIQTDLPLKEFVFSSKINKNFLQLPIKNGARLIPLTITGSNVATREYAIGLALDGKPDWWAYFDTTPYVGKEMEIKFNSKILPSESELFEKSNFRPSDRAIDDPSLYEESLRPRFHFTPRCGFNNDPNGLAFFNGQYHLFFQYNPFGLTFGNHHWGHAVSKDLVHWEELNPAMYPLDITKPMYSGGASVDVGNKLGFGTGTEDVLITGFASMGRGDSVATATGNALQFVDFPGNPVLKAGGWGDPKVVYYAPSNKWLWLRFEKESATKFGYAIYETPDFKTFKRLGMIEGFQDCPDLFELPVEGDPGVKKWVLYGAKKTVGQQYADRSSYMVGSFDGNQFTPESEIMTGNYGPVFYAGQVFSNAPEGRKVMMAWLCNSTFPKMPFGGGFSVPLELSLRKTEGGPRLCMFPAKELDVLHDKTIQGKDLTMGSANELLSKGVSDLFDLQLEMEIKPGSQINLTVKGIPLSYNAGSGEFSCQKQKARIKSSDGHLKIRLLGDHGVLECFVDDGLVAMTFGDATVSASGIKLEGSNYLIMSVQLSEMKSIWK
ncbi:MAG: glycoside hydrolase family 32 protein [Verrucomicrobiota bacterium]